MPKTQFLKFNFHKNLRLGIALVSGLLMGLCTAPVSAWPLAWVALVPLWVLMVKTEKPQGMTSWDREKLPHQLNLHPSPLTIGLLWGIGYHGLALFWITGVHPMTWMGVPWLASLAIALFCWTFITLWGAALVVCWSAGMRAILNFRFQILKGQLIPQPKIGKSTNLEVRTSQDDQPYKLPNSLVRVLIGTALWCGLEALWCAGPLWWTSLSYTQSPHNLAILHLTQLSGPSTVTAAIVAVNGLIAEGLLSWQVGRTDQPTTFRTWMIAAGLCVGLHLAGWGLYNRPLIQPPEAALKVGIIQGNIPNDIKLFVDGKRLALERYTAGYQTLANQGVDAVLTPEGALPFFLEDLKGTPFYSAVLEKGVTAWVGAYGEQGRSYTNSLFTMMGDGATFSRYDKVKLVPLGEYIPFEQVIGGLIDRLSPLEAHMVAGKPTQLFETPFGRAIVGICYESAFAQHFRRQASAGGEFILTASNNAHYSKTMPAQHHAQDVMRAIETDRWAVRATNTGYSGIVDPHGRTLWLSGINTYEIHAATIYRRQTQTLYSRWGDWLTPGLLIGGAISWFPAFLLNTNEQKFRG